MFRSLFAPPRHMILLVLAVWIGLTLSEKRAERHGVSRDDLNNLTFYSLIAFVLGGRILFALENISAFTKSPLSLLSINLDLFDPLGGLSIAALAGLAYIQRRHMAVWPVLDAITPFLATLMVGLGLSQLAAGTAFGKETNLPWGIQLWNASRHPTQIYATIAALLTLLLVWLKRPVPQPGVIFLVFVAATAAWQLLILGFRADGPALAGGFRQAQILAWLVMAAAFVLLEFRLARGHESA